MQYGLWETTLAYLVLGVSLFSVRRMFHHRLATPKYY